MTFTLAEQEAIVLNAAWEQIDGMVNQGIFCPLSKTENTNLLPQTALSARLFNILLTDFLSAETNPAPFDLPVGPQADPVGRTMLFYLRRICTSPQFNKDPCAISKPVEAFSEWLAAECVAKDTWLPNVDIALDFHITRIELIKFCGDIAKHNYLRLGNRAQKLVRLMKRNGHPIEPEEAYKMLPDFYEKFHHDVFAYHTSTIAEFLSEIRFGIRQYIMPAWAEAYVELPPIMELKRWKFEAPPSVTNAFAKDAHWSLMGRAMKPFTFPRFSVSPHCKEDF